MMDALKSALLTLSLAMPMAAAGASGNAVVVTVTNPIKLPRPSETIVLPAAELRRYSLDDLRRVHVHDPVSGKDLLTQPVDLDDDGIFDELLFQCDIGPGETRTFELRLGEPQVPRREDFRAYGRFVRERRDDFAWENDRIAHRMYGAALETWKREPLTSSAVDVWVKRVPRLVINDWYMVDDYHRDHGEGADLYSAGSTRGCGGNGLWVGGRLYPSANFRASRVLANGPIRVLFELAYDAWDADGTRVSETKRISLDAGHNFDRFESHYAIERGPRELTHAIGIKKVAGASFVVSPENASMRTWEPVEKQAGEMGCAVIVEPAVFAKSLEDKSNYLLTAKVPSANVAVYYAGFGWSRSGQFASLEDWDRYVSAYAQRLRAPVTITFTAK